MKKWRCFFFTYGPHATWGAYTYPSAMGHVNKSKPIGESLCVCNGIGKDWFRSRPWMNNRSPNFLLAWGLKLDETYRRQVKS